MKYEVSIIHLGRTLKLKLYCSWEPGSKGWVFRYGNGYRIWKIAVIQGKHIHYRDSMFKAIEEYMQKLWDMIVVQKLTFNTDTVKDFYGIISLSDNPKTRVSLPAWKAPMHLNYRLNRSGIQSHTSSSAKPVEMHEVLLDFMKKPETVERILLAETSNKFGL